MKRIFTFLLFTLCLLTFSISTFAATANKGELSKLLNEMYDPSQYTVESYQTYQNAVNNAIAVYENDGATQEDVDAVTEKLRVAKNGLTFILNRALLLDYVDSIEEILYSTNYDLTAETVQILNTVKNDFLKRYESETLTQEELDAASTKFLDIINAEESSKEIEKFSSDNADENIIVPSKVISSTKGLGRVTAIRLTLLGFGVVFIALGIAAGVLYIKPPKFLQYLCKKEFGEDEYGNT